MEAFTSAPPEPTSPTKRRPARLARTCERFVCNVVKYFPLAFVYGLSTWALWVELDTSRHHTRNKWGSTFGTILGLLFYILMNTSYTFAVFTDPGSPLATRSRNRSPNFSSSRPRHEYSHLPTTEDREYSALTVNSSGRSRYCRKCQCPKPDRAHHCSTCKRCVLKMDHHCPWLATCVGFHNYKAFLLFLTYTCLFCYVCFVVAASWVYYEFLEEVQHNEHVLPINVILLAIIAGIMGLILSAFTSWHISLGVRGLTTIECLEKTRYLVPVRETFDRQRRDWQYRVSHPPQGEQSAGQEFGRTLQNYGQQFLEMHANALPGVTRAEEGEERPSPTTNTAEGRPHGYNPAEHAVDYRSPAQQSLFRSYEDLDRARERDRYEEYLAERDSEKLPHAFDLGWRRNLAHLLGPRPLLWLIPVPSTTGDGWHWEASSSWVEAKRSIEQQRIERWEQAQYQQQQAAQGHQLPYYERGSWHPPVDRGHSQSQAWAGRPGNASNDPDRPSTGMSMKTLRPMSPRHRSGEGDIDADNASDRYSTSSDEDIERQALNPARNSITRRTYSNDGCTKQRIA
ncbi:palmitoyltransferase for Vac8p [Myotisia sp. PD_48]|nr:palmitoyltransferase for Vac8p [Myotisia sp. PD_48]